MDFNQSLSEWAKDKPLSILQLDPADRAVLKIADERDAIQKKTFTKWVNKHLKKGNRHIDDLFEDIRDGHNLISLLEVLATEILPREKGRLRFHMLQNVQTVLDFLKFKKIKLVNIRPEDIVDGNPKLTLGLIWTIILHFQISDIITGISDESVTAREALLRWAQRTTERYPGVRVVDFTNSWKDGLAFNAILHRNRPELLDFRSLRTRSARDNLDSAFSLAEKEFGITRLLDPEDVDTPEPDEKSIITYISSVYDVFPDPPTLHPLINEEKHQKVEEYKELAINLQMWMQESLATLRSRNYPNTVSEMKVLHNERARFRSDDVPKRLKVKHKLCQLHNEIQKLAKETGKVTFEGDLSLDSVEKRWNHILTAHQENETSIREEISRLEKLQKVADKINRETKMCDVKLDDIEKKIFEEEKRIQRLYTVDAKHNCDQIEGSLKGIEESLKSMKKDVKILAEGRYHQTVDVDKRIHVIYERYSSIRSTFQTQLLLPLSTKPVKIEEKKVVKQRAVSNEQKSFDSSKIFHLLKEHIEWVEKKKNVCIKRLNDLDSGTDLLSIKSSFEQHKNDHKLIENYKRKIDQCSSQKNNFTGEDFSAFCELLTQLEKSHSELLTFSSSKLHDIETLVDFVQSTAKELKWMSEKEEIEVSRDWSAKNFNFGELEHYQEVLTSELEKREIQLNAIQNRGESLLLQKHSSSKCIEYYVCLLQSQWSWLLQLTLCLETHLKHAQSYHQFFKEVRECEQLLKRVEDKLQTSFSRMPVSVDEGEKTLKQIHHLREELSGYSDIILSVIKRSHEIVPLKQRRLSVLKPINVVAVCKYKQSNICISKNEEYLLYDNSHRTKWKVGNSIINEAIVPSVCFVIPPVNAEAVEIGENLKKRYDAIIASWTGKEQKLRQNLIIATIRVVKSWDIAQFRTMETSQRESIICALNDDTQKLLDEGSGDESTLLKLKQEMEQCNQLYHSLVEKLTSDESHSSSKSSGKKLLDEMLCAQSELSDKEKLLKAKLHEPITWNLDALENFVIEHKEFEMTLRSFEDKLKEIKQIYSNLAKKSTTCQTKFDTLVSTWDKLWELSNLYIERLKSLEISLHAFTEATQVVSNFEVQLASFEKMPSDMDNLKRVYERLMCLQTEMQQHQTAIDAVSESARNLKNLIHKTRPKQVVHSDLKKFENDVKKLNVRWENVSLQLVERLRSCSAASELLRTYKNKTDEDNVWTSETTIKVNSLKSIKTMTTKEVEMQVEPVMNLYSSIAERNSSFELTNILGARYIREAKNEIQENYKTCKENTSNLLVWMAEIETRLANLGLVREDLSSLQQQINSAKVLKDDLENQQHLVNTCLDQLRQLIQKGLEILSKEEIHELQRDLQSVKRRYDILINECDRLLRRLVAALEELQKFKSELCAFKEWLNGAQKEFNEKEKQLGNLKKLTKSCEVYRVFASDVIAHQADLRFIAMAAQKFLDESKDYLKTLNMLRVNLSKSSPNLEPLESEVKTQVQEISALFHNLLNSVNKLSDHYVIVHNKHRYYIESFEKANSWFRDAKSSGEKVLEEPMSAEPAAVQEQLDYVKTLNMEVVGQGRLIENSIQSAKALVDCLNNLQVKSVETQNVQITVNSLQNDYQSLVNAITLKIKELQTALIQSQDIQDGLDRLLRWLDETENCLRNQSKPISLIVEKLDEQVQEFKILQSDVNNQKQSIDTINIPSKELMNSNPKSAKTIESKLKDIIARYDKVCERIDRREQLLEEISTSVRMFETMSNQFEEWTSSIQDRIESHDMSQQLDVDGFASVIEYTMNQRNAKQNEYEDMIKIGKNLIMKHDVTDSLKVKDKIKNLEHMWKNLGAVLNEKQSLGKARSEQLAAYEVMRSKVMEWISKMETTIDNSEPISLDQVILKKQLAEIKPLLKEYSENSSTIEKLNNLGHNYDLMVKGESPCRKAASPVKKQSSPTRKSPSKGKSPDSTPTSPIKNQLNTQSPLSTVSSGFSSHRSSTENFSGIEDHSPIQLQLSEINHRYSLLGAKLSDRSQEINQMNDELKSYIEVIKTIKVFLEAKEKQLPKENLPSSKEQAEKYLKLLKVIQDEMMEKQSEMDNFRIRAKEILHSKIDVKGASELQCQVTELEEKWSKLWISIKRQILFLQDLKDFQDAQVLLSSWLSQREKMFLVLGPIASEPRMVSSQVQQVQAMKDEFSSQKSLLDRFNQCGTAIIQHLESINANTKKVTEQMENIHHVWADLMGRLEERDKNLEAACGVAKDFYRNHSHIQEKLQKISDSFDQLFELNTSVDEQLKKLVGLEEQLEKQRPLLTDIDSICDQLCDILNDAASKNDIRNKINALEKAYANLCKKINNKKAELESCLKEDEGFYKSCNDVEIWLNKTDALFSTEIKFSASVDKLKSLAQNYEPTYKAIMDKEHELHLLISKGTDMVGKILIKQEQKNLKAKLDNIQKQWSKLKKIAIDRRTHIHRCLDNCQNFCETMETFVPWLEASEKKLTSIKPVSLQRTVLSKQIKEMQSFKNDLTKHIQEFENLRQLGDILMSTCIIDKDSIHTQIDQLKKRWDQLNQNISVKIQTFEDLSMKIIEYKEKLRDVQHAVQRLEDKLSSHDALGNVSRDPILLNRLKSLHKEATSLEKNLTLVKEFSQIVISKAGSTTDASEILKDIENTENKLHILIKTLDDRCSSLATATKIISTFTTQVKSIHSEIESLSDVFDQMSPLARDKNVLQQQMIEIKEFTTRLIKIREALKTAENQCNSIISEGYVAEPKSFREQISSLQKQVVRFEEHIKVRETSIEGILSRLERFHTNYTETRKELETIIKEEKAFQFIGGDVDSIRVQQQKFKIFRTEKIQPLSKLLEECNRMGQGIIQSAAPDVNTNDLEQDLENLNESWNSLQERINEREKKLDVALLQSGKFQEALSGVQKWLKDTEEMVINQKAPSADFKVVKAQVQEQKFLKKMLLDRQNSVMSLKVMGAEFMQSTVTKKEQEQVDSQMSTIIERFDELRASAEDRMSLLEKTIPGTQELQNMLSPLNEWLEQIDKKLAMMSTIPVETELVKKKITEHKKLHEDIISHKKQVEKLREVSEKLKKLIGKDEAQSLEQKVKTVTSKFSEITETSCNLSKELAAAERGITVFTEKYEKTVTWIDKTTIHLSHFQVFSVYFDKLQEQIKNLKKIKDNINKEKTNIGGVLTSGQDIMKHASGEDTIQIKEKLDTLSIKFADLNNRVNERLKLTEDSLPLVQSFYDANSKISMWLDSAEKSMKTLDTVGLNIQQTTIHQLQSKIQEFRSVLETLNHTGPRICQLSPGDGSTTIENMMSKANHRFEALSELIQRKAERIELAVQRKFDVVGDIEELLDWFKEIENQVNNAEGLSPEPSSLSVLLKEQKAISDEVNSQRTRVRDILTSAKKLMRESSSEDLSFIREKAETLKTISSDISSICQDRLSTIEQALPLAEHFFETHTDLGQWLEVAEGEAELLEAPALNAIQIKKQQDRNKGLVQSVHEHKPLVDKLNKTGSALTKLCKDDETEKVEVILESDNSRYNALRQILREHQNALEEALQATAQFSDKLEGMLSALTSTADQIQNAEPISAHPERIQEQINDNKAVLQDLEKRTSALEAVKKAADDVIVKASSIDEPAVRDIKKKLDRLNDLWDTIQTAARNRGKSLEEALVAAEKFWDELTAVMKALKELQDNLNNQESPAVEPSAVQQQQEVLQEIKQEITQTKPEVDHCRQAGQDLMQLCGEPDKPEVKKHIEDLDSVWENVTTLYAKREQNLIDAMEKAMNFHETLQNLLEFLDAAEHKFSDLGAVSADIDTVKKQIFQLKEFKTGVDPHMVEVESLNRQAQELVERTSPDQSLAIREPLDDINKRWDDLLKGIVDRQQEMENALLKLGQFQHALEELMIWMSKTEKVLDDLKPVFGDPQVIEVVLAKHKVLTNDIQAHEASIETINRAGRQLIEKDESEDAKSTQNKLNSLNVRWEQLQEKSSERERELEEALKEALQFHQEIQDLLMWLSDIDGQLVTSKPVGGLPETAREQLNRFMDLYTELDGNRHKVENVLQQGQSYLKRSGESSTKKLQHSLQTLRQRWENVLNKANDRKIKLEIALREATEFHEALQSFVEWLTNAEKYLTGLKPVSRYMNTVLEQIEDHRNFQKDIGAHREVMLNLDKKGTHLKYFSQKQDVILIKNLLISVQHRWERIVSKAAERTRSLDHGYKEAKEFHDAWTSMSTWLDEAEKTLDSITHIGNDPIKIKQLLAKHKEFQRILGSKQASFDTTMRVGRALKDRCPKQDVPVLQEMMDELKSRWNRVCSKSVDRQRKLEEALLYSGQFKEAVQALMDWLDKSLLKLSDAKLYHGDLDTVTSLVEQHKTFEEELKNRGRSLETIRKTAEELKESASPEDAQRILTEVEKLELKWKQISDMSESYKCKLDEALKQAESLYKNVHMLLEWLSDAEIKLRFVGPLPEDEETIKKQIATHEEFLKEMEKQEINKNVILDTAQEILKKCHPDGISAIRHWITIIQSRWEEISIWARQRDQRLKDHLRSLKDIMELLEELLMWLTNAEATLTTLEAEPLPDDLPILERLIKEHQVFMDNISKKQPDVEKITKAFSPKREIGKVLPQVSTPKEKSIKDRSLRGATPSPIKTSTPLKQQGDSDIKHPRARLLLDKWRTVWILAMERQRRLQDKYNYLLELERIKNFDFNEWRRRYLGWMNNKKSRIMDQFRKIDKNNDGKVTKQEFIDGILRSKFTTSRLEMERVADIFDINGDGFIDSKEYVDTLRPDRESGPQTDAEKIQDEVQRQVAKCTCVHRFKVYQVGEGKYRFGDSQKLRLVRILRSTVMVRVGGGWVALDEFLVKNDPCRAKGRTNLELREQFILAEGVSQSMAPFKPKPSPNSSVSSQSGASFSRSGNSIPSAGPITKIREKSERSTPMHQGRSSAETSSDISGPSFSEMDSSSNRSGLSRVSPSTARLSPRTLGSKPSSRPSSRQGSRPSSRAPSDLSQDGVDDYKKNCKVSGPQNTNLGVKNSVGAIKTTAGTVSSKIPSVKRTPPKISVIPANHEKSKKEIKK